MPFGPNDYLGGSRGPLPASFEGPDMSNMLYRGFASLPGQYEQGQKIGMAQALRQAFPGGLPKLRDGTLDSNAILNKVVGISGLGPESLGPLMTLSARQAVAAGDVPPGAPSGDTAGLRGPQTTPPPPPTARSWLGLGGPVAADNGEPDSVRSLWTGIGKGQNVGENVLRRFAVAVGVKDPDAPLSPEQTQMLTKIMGRSAGYLAGRPSQSPISSDEGVDQAAGNTYAQDYAYSGDAGATTVTSGAGGGPQGLESPSAPSSASSPMLGASTPAREPPPRPTPFTAGGGPRQVAEPAAGGVTPPPRVAQAQPGAELVPPQLRHMAPPQAAAWLMSRAQQHAAIGDVEAAKLLAQQAQTIQDAIKQNVELTPEQKLARQQGMTPLQYEQAKTQQTEDVKRFTKLNAGVQALGNTSAILMPKIQAAESLINDPTFYSGLGAQANLIRKQISAMFGFNPNAALTQEAFGKTMSDFILAQTNNLKAEAEEMGGSSSRIFAAQIDQMVKASPSPDYTPSSNRYLLETYKRAAQRAMFIADQANKLGGHVDANFETWMRNWQLEHPMFSKEELADPRRVAPPVVRSPDDLRAIGWRDGEPFRSAVSGKVFTHLPKGAQ